MKPTHQVSGKPSLSSDGAVTTVDYAPDEQQFAADVAAFITRVGGIGAPVAGTIAAALIGDQSSPLVILLKPVVAMEVSLQETCRSLDRISELAERMVADG